MYQITLVLINFVLDPSRIHKSGLGSEDPDPFKNLLEQYTAFKRTEIVAIVRQPLGMMTGIDLSKVPLLDDSNWVGS
jgi:hypothetical protein